VRDKGREAIVRYQCDRRGSLVAGSPRQKKREIRLEVLRRNVANRNRCGYQNKGGDQLGQVNRRFLRWHRDAGRGEVVDEHSCQKRSNRKGVRLGDKTMNEALTRG